MKVRQVAIILAASMLLAAPAPAAVLSAGETGAVIERSVAVAAPPATVWAALLQPARWWSSAHSWSGDARNFTLEARAGGCFCEALSGGGSVEHMRVVFVQPGKMLRMTGGLGPLQADAAAGPLTFTLTPAAAGTTLTLRYAFAGMTRMPVPVLAPIVDGVLGEQLARLRAVAEGRPPALAASSRGTAPPAK